MQFSIVIPTLNEARDLPGCVEHLRAHIHPDTDYEIVVADCGSTDGTPEIARGLNCRRVEENPEQPCRAAGLNLGADHARGAVLVFLAADTLVPRNFDRAIAKALGNSRVLGGGFHMRFIERTVGLAIIAFINYVRYHLFRDYYGDQVLFVRADALRAVGGCPRVEILESAFLCRELRKRGKLKLLRPWVQTSGRRFLEGGTARVFAKDVKIWLLDLLGVNVNSYGREYWAHNANK